MRIAVCDDSPAARAELTALLRACLAARALPSTAEILEYDSGEALTAAFFPGAFALLFLDIYMGGMTGVETARRLKALDPDCTVVFTTTSREHGADAFDVGAFHYLLKPVSPEKLCAVLDKWRAANDEIRTVSLKCGRTERVLYVRDILYVDVLRRQCTVHTKTETVVTSLPLVTLSALLPADEFVRPIRYCLAALAHIRSVGAETCLLDNGEQLPLSRQERENVRAQFAAYRLRALRRRG